MPQSTLTLAYYQQDICWEDPKRNFLQVERKLLQDLPSGIRPDIIIVPETFSTGFSDNMARMAELPEGPAYRAALDIAQRFDALFVGTWTVKVDGKIYNRLHWVRPDGSYGSYDKGHTFRMSSEASQLARGTSRPTFSWRGWRIRPAICYDLRFPKWLRNEPLVKGRAEGLDYDLLIICANWPGSRHQAWSTLLQARAIENECYVAGVNRVGIDGVGIPYQGCSAVIDYKGQIVSQCAPGADELQVATLSKSDLDTFRDHWPFYLDAD